MLWSGSEVGDNLREHLEAVGNLRSSSEAIGKSSVIMERYRKIYGNSGYVKTKISRIGLKNSWQVYNKKLNVIPGFIPHRPHAKDTLRSLKISSG